MNEPKIIHIIPAHSLWAVIREVNDFCTVKVSALELIEDGDDQGYKISRRERVVFPFKGKLTNSDDVPEFIGVADSQGKAEGVFIRSLSEDGYRAYFDRICSEIREQRKPLDWSDGNDRCARPVIDQMVAN